MAFSRATTRSGRAANAVAHPVQGDQSAKEGSPVSPSLAAILGWTSFEVPDADSRYPATRPTATIVVVVAIQLAAPRELASADLIAPIANAARTAGERSAAVAAAAVV